MTPENRNKDREPAPILCEHMQVYGALEAYCPWCLVATRSALGVDSVTARFVLALHHGWAKPGLEAS